MHASPNQCRDIKCVVQIYLQGPFVILVVRKKNNWKCKGRTTSTSLNPFMHPFDLDSVSKRVGIVSSKLSTIRAKMKYKHHIWYIKAWFARIPPSTFTSTKLNPLIQFSIKLDVQFPTAPTSTHHGSSLPNTNFTPTSIHKLILSTYTTAYILGRGLLRRPVIPANDSISPTATASTSELRADSQPSTHKWVTQGGAPNQIPIYTWIEWNGLLWPF